MARHSDQAPRAERVVALAAVAFLAVATALAFGRVFVGPGPTWKLIAAAVASASVASLLERRSLLLATLASAALLLFAVGILVFPEATLGGLPRRETLGAIARAIGRVGEQARVQVAPTPPLPPLLLAAITAVWTATFSTHALAVRAGSPILAALPPVALVGFADTVMEDGARPLYAVVFLTAVLAVAFVDGLRRIRQWGPVWPWPGRGRRLSATTTRGARRVAAVVVGVAAFLPGILPGFRSDALIDLGGGQGGNPGIDPLVSIQAELKRSDPIDLFEVSAPRPSYWRMLALDQWDGTRWSTSDLQVSNGTTLQTPAELPASVPLGGDVLEQHFRVLNDLGFQWVPMAFPPVSIDLSGDTIRYDQTLVSAYAPEGLSEGQEYHVTSQPVAPTAEELDAITQADFPTPAQNPRYTELPPDTSQAIFDIANRWTEGKVTPFRQILAIQNHLRDPKQFRYSLDVKNDADPVHFLTRTRAGFCQQFASAMAILVRALGYPSRVAVGFTEGTRDGDTGPWLVTTANAHSWVEVLFPVYGWLAFEPTPSRSNPVANAYLAPPSPAGCGPRELCDPGETGAGRQSDRAVLRRQALIQRLLRSERAGGSLQGIGEERRRLPYGLVARTLLALAGALLLLVPLAKGLVRMLRLRREHEPRRRVLATYEVFAGQAADLGLGRAGGETLAEYGRRVQAGVESSDGHLGLLAGITARAAYSPRPISEEDAREAVRAARTAIRDMRRSTGLARRVAGIYRPGL